MPNSKKMSTLDEFGHLFLDSLNHRSKAKEPINRSAKAVINRKLTTSLHNHLFFYFVFVSYINKTDNTVISA